jgi:PAS domain S-box-containing protein
MSRSKLNLFIIFIVFALILSVVNISIDKLFFGDTTQNIALSNGIIKSKEREDFVNDFLFQSEQTLESIRKLDVFEKYLTDETEQKTLENIFLSYSMSQTSFMQLRYIDENGFEKIRIDRDKEKLQPYIISKDMFQNKADRYYFFDSKTKPLEKVWFSAIDLNMEKGSVEIPYRPTLRAMLPISKDGKFTGVLIINYLMDDFIEKLTNTPLYDMILYNDKGFPLYHYDQTKSWGYYSTPQYSIASDFPNEYKQILDSDLLKSKYFISKKLNVPIYGGLHLILQLKKSYIEKQETQFYYRNITVTFFTFLISFILTLVIVKLFSEKLLNISKLTKLNQELNSSEEMLKKNSNLIEKTYKELEISYNNISEISKKYESEKYKYKSILDSASDGIFITNMDGKLLEFSKMAKELLGYNDTEMSKLYVYDWDIKYSKEEVLNLLKSTPSTTITLETIHKRKDETSYYASITAIKIKIDNIDYIYASVRDITKQKETENKILEQKLEFETIFHSSKDGIAILDMESNFINFNQAYLDITGFTGEELLTKSCIELTAPEDRQESIDIMSSILEIGHIENFQKTCIVKGGKRVFTNMSISLLPDKKRILLLTKDITGLRLMEEQGKLASMGEMIGNIAHQWRQPLSVISTAVTGMKLQKEYNLLTDKIFNDDCDAINENVQYLSKTIDDFRNFIKGDESFSNVKISEIIEDTLHILDASFLIHYIKINLSIDDDLEIYANKNELQQALINILNNAKDILVEKIDDKERMISISTKKIDDSSLELKICDTGGGIPADVIERIFEPYFTTKHQSQGTGLGLSMTHKIITERHNQVISIANEKFKYNDKEYIGACFKIIFTKN